MPHADSRLAEIERKLDCGRRALDGRRPRALPHARISTASGRMARAQKERKSGKKVYYVLNRYINSTNVCYAGCKFCSFAADEFKEPATRLPDDGRSGLRQGDGDRHRTSIKSTSSAGTTLASSRSTTGCR